MWSQFDGEHVAGAERRLLVCRVPQIKGFLALLPGGKKCEGGPALESEGARQCQFVHAGFFIDEDGGAWMRLPSGQWTLLGSNQHVLRDEPG